MKRYTWVPPVQGYNVVSIVERDEDRAKDKVRMHVRTQIREWNMRACEYYGMNDTDNFPFERHTLAVTDVGDIYEHMRS